MKYLRSTLYNIADCKDIPIRNSGFEEKTQLYKNTKTQTLSGNYVYGEGGGLYKENNCVGIVGHSYDQFLVSATFVAKVCGPRIRIQT